MEDSLLETFTKKEIIRKNLIRFMRIILREKRYVNLYPQFNRDIEFKIN